MLKSITIVTLFAIPCNICFSQVGGTNWQRDSLKHELTSAKDDTSRVLAMIDVAYAYWSNNLDTVDKFATRALALAQRIQFSRGEASALNALGAGFQSQGDCPKSFEFVYRSLRISKERNYEFETAVSYALIGSGYWYLGDFTKVVDWAKRSQNLLEALFKSRGVRDWMLLNVLDIGQGYLDQYRLDSSYHYLLQYYNATLHDKFWHPVALYSLGDCLFRQGNRGISFNYVRESISGAAANNDYFTIAEACAVMSRIFNTVHQRDSAIYYAKKGLAAADSMGDVFGIYRHSKLLAEEYEPLDVNEALYYRKMYDSVNEEMYGAKKVQALQKTLAEEQQRQQQAQEEQIKKESRLKQYGFIAGLLILVFIAFILYRNNVQRKKANVVLQHQKEKVENTLQELKSTQAQLIQSEKMASLGELTAGIAHEIQNPLNFVNNFSEVNKELIEELKSQGNEESQLWSNILQNNEKIIFHGKRADAIVKSMLQHSRISSGQRELTDINALCDEYLRLSYHGFRAKDKSFKAEIKTDFDVNIGKISVVPQDIGRVLLNLYNNAFYAVTEKASHSADGYQPKVIVHTKKGDGKITISVRDNGKGVPEKVVDKIFQPFFTTKPTGQGTGLGLSLSYDIIQAHKGEMKVETRQGEFAEFSIHLPLN